MGSLTSLSFETTLWSRLFGLEPSPLTMILSLAGGILILIPCVQCSIPLEKEPRKRTQWILVRMALAIPTAVLFIDLIFAPCGVKSRYFRTAGVTNGIYGMLKTWEICFSSLIDGAPLPSWVKLSTSKSNGIRTKSETQKEGNRDVVHTVDDRGWLYSFDVISTLRGVSWLSDRRFDIATPSLVEKITTPTTRSGFVLTRIPWFLVSLLVMDAIDTVSKEWVYMDGKELGRIALLQSISVDTLYPAYAHQATNKPVLVQVALVACTALSTQFSVEMFYTSFGLLCVGVFNVSPSAFPHFFNNPFYIHNYTSVRHFWGYQWHHIFRHVMTRVTDPLLHIVRIPKRSAYGTIARVVIAFTLSGLIHCIIQARAQALYLAPNVKLIVLDPDTLRFFMSQPLAIAFEHLFIIPLVKPLPILVRRVAMVLWTLGWLTWSARWWVDVWIKMGMYQPEERVVLFSIIRGLLRGEWYIAGLPNPS